MQAVRKFVKRDGRVVDFDVNKIALAIQKAFAETGEISDSPPQVAQSLCLAMARVTADALNERYPDATEVLIEAVQDEVERILMHRYPTTAKAYILYRKQRETSRDKKTRLMKTIDDIILDDEKASNLKRENANIDAKTPMGTMLKIGSETSKQYYIGHMLSPEYSQAHVDGDIHIHDLDFYSLTATCCQLDIADLFERGFSTGHGFLREPNSIASYGSLAAIALQGNQNDMHGGQSIPQFDRAMAIGVRKTFRRLFVKHLEDIIEVRENKRLNLHSLYSWLKSKYPCDKPYGDVFGSNGFDFVREVVDHLSLEFKKITQHAVDLAYSRALRDTERQTYQAMEAFIHNLNTMHSRAGAQVPFSSINYGTDTSYEGRLVVKTLLESTIAGLGKGETPIFPIQIFRVKKGVNMDEGDPNYDLFRLALRCQARRMYPNFAFQDAPYNLQYYKEGDYRTEIAYMGCRTRVVDNVYDPSNKIVTGRGNLSFTSINLPRLAILADGNIGRFYQLLDARLELVADQLLERFEVQCRKTVQNYPFLMGQGIWLGSKGLRSDDSVAEVLKHGTLSIGFIGLAEALILLTGYHHGESSDAQALGLKIVGRMKNFCDCRAAETLLNFSLLATPAEGLSGRFVELDAKRFGSTSRVTDKGFYTNSFHVPVDYDITAFDKINIEAPYHALTNAGHISYVEFDGAAVHNIDALEIVVKHMAEAGVGYGAINHPIDRDPVCGYTGVIGNTCPRCGRTEDDGDYPFERIRRITGYLVGTLDRFNDAKRREESMRVKHQ